MKISNCLIITDDTSVIEMKPDEARYFQGNRVVHRSKLASGVLQKWGAPVSPLSDADAPSADQGRSFMDEEIVHAGFGD